MPAGSPTIRDRFLRAGVLAVAAAALAGCQSIQSTTAGSPEIRLLDASPTENSNGMDFYLNTTALVYNLGYNVKTSPIPVAAGNYTVNADAAGTTQVLASAALSPRTGQHYTVIASNALANLQLTALTDEAGPAPTGEINVRLIDESLASGGVDVYFIPSGGKLTTTSPVATGLTFGSNTGYLSIPSGAYEIAILPAGTVPIATTVASYTGAQVTYASGEAQTFVIDDAQVTTTPTLNVVTLSDYPYE